MQPNFMIDGIRHFVYTKHNGDNAKLKIFFIIPQRQRIQPNFKNDNIRTFPSYIRNNLTFMLLQLRQRKFSSIHIQTSQ